MALVLQKKIQAGCIDDLLGGLTDEEIAIIEAAISAHSSKDSLFESYEKKYNIGNHERYLLIATCLKDADGLDRVRLGDLDTKHLRHSKSCELVDYAEELFASYNQEKINMHSLKTIISFLKRKDS